MSTLIAMLFAGHLAVAAQPAAEVSWETHKERADSAFAEEKWAVAERLYRQAITSARDAQVDLSTRADLHNQLGRSLYEADQLAQARKVYQRGLDLHQRGGSGDSSDAAAIWYNLGHVLADLGNSDDAESAYRKCAQLERVALGADSLELAVTLAQLGNHLTNAKDYVGADEPLAEAARIRQAQGDALTATSLKDWAINRYRLSDYEQAIALAKQAIELSSGGAAEAAKVRGLSFNVIAMANESQGNYRAAGANYRHALRILRDAVGFQDDNFQSVAGNYADMAIDHEPGWGVEAPE